MLILRMRNRTTLLAVGALAVVLSVLMLPGTVARAAEGVRETTSLEFVPADTALYVACLRNREQFDRLVQSRAFARIMQIPTLQVATMLIQGQWNNPSNEDLSRLKALMQEPENQQLVDLLVDGLSHEVFFCGSEDFANQLALLRSIQSAMNRAQLQAAATGEDAEELVGRQLLEILIQHAEDFSVPAMLLGMRQSDTAQAEAQLARLETLLQEIIEEQPELKGRLERETIGETDYLTLRLDGSLLPWDKLSSDDLDVNAEQLETLINKVKKLKLTVSLGVRGNYLLLAAGETNEHLASLGSGQLLANRQELAPLMRAGEKSFTSIAYLSQAFMSRIQSMDRQIDDLVHTVEQIVPNVEELDESLRKELLSDAKALGEDLKQYAPNRATSWASRI